MVRFIDKNLIIQFINDLISMNKFYINMYIFDVFNSIHIFDNVDFNYINDMMLFLKLIVK